MTSCHHRVCQPLVQLFLLLAGFRLVAFADISITKQPQNTTLDAGQTLRLSVEYSGEIPTSVYWTRDNQTIAGASATNLVITNMTVNKGGIYRAHLVKHSVITESDPAVVLVNDMYWGPVGFINLEVTPGLQLMTFPLRSTMTVAQLFHTLPAGVTLYKMDGNGYRANNYFNGWSDPDMIIVPGEAIFVHNANPHSMTLTTHGYLLLGQLTTRLPAGFSAFGTLVPRTGSIMEHYNLPPNSETTLYRFNKATQSFTTYAWPFDAPSWTLAMGEGLFAYSPYEQQLMTYFTIDFGFGSIAPQNDKNTVDWKKR